MEATLKTIRAFQILSFILLFSMLVSLAGIPTLTARAATTITFTAEELLGKPEDTSITINIVPASTIEYHYQYGLDSNANTWQTPTITATGGQPSEVTITGLTANTHYYYRMRYHLPGETDWVERTVHSFWTQRSPGSTFVFTVTSDWHAQLGTNAQNASTNIMNEAPDFEIDLGDTFYPATGTTTQTAVNNSYLAFREPQYMDRFGHSSPIFLSSGNHEEEEGWNLDDTPFSIGVGSIQARKAYFPTPQNDAFYSANIDPLAAIDEATYGDEMREDYYAWTWGDALFVVIDEFQYTMHLPYTPAAGEGSNDTKTCEYSGDTQCQWNWTLGATQYNWLKNTLQNSTAKYKFVFSHNMVGGIPSGTISGAEAGYVRGGAEAAGYFEWGGKNYNGTEGFTSHRSTVDFPIPIHQLFVNTGVSAYFHGHDHQYVYETRGGVVYQEVPSPTMSGLGFDGIYYEGTYTDYSTIRRLASPGHLRIQITPTLATVQYISSSSTSGTVNYTYDIEPNGPKYTLTTAVDNPSHGSIDPAAGPHSYSEDASVNVTATANTGWVFSGWSGSGACSGTTNPCSVVMSEDKDITANFSAVPTHTLTTAVDPIGGGTINPAVGGHVYNEGVQVNVTAAPASGYLFDHWSGACSDSGTCSVTMDADKTVTANFVLDTNTLSVIKAGTGSGSVISSPVGIDCGYDCSEIYAKGISVVLTATPTDHYNRFLGWSGTGISCPGKGTCTVSMTTSRTVTATFEKSTFGDVPFDYPNWAYIQALYDGGYTSGCSTSPLNFCPEATLTRAESAVFMLRGLKGTGYTPPADPAGYVFVNDDWAPSTVSWARSWSEGMWDEGMTSGCQTDPLMFCPAATLTRAEGGVFGERIKRGMSYTPPAATHIFTGDDWTPASVSWAEAWAEQAYNDGLLLSCGTGPLKFCPADPLSRSWAAYIIAKAKNLTLPTP
jgi:hypothetical protein